MFARDKQTYRQTNGRTDKREEHLIRRRHSN